MERDLYVCPTPCEAQPGSVSTHFFAVLTHDRADPGRAKLLSAQQTAGHPISTHRLLHVVEAVYQSPAGAPGPPPSTPRSTSGTFMNESVSYPILSCSMASIFSARAITPFMISFSSSVRSGPGLGPGFVVQLPLATHFKLQLRHTPG